MRTVPLLDNEGRAKHDSELEGQGDNCHKPVTHLARAPSMHAKFPAVIFSMSGFYK